MPPILQTLITLTIRILLRLLLLRKMSLAVRNDLAHVINVVLLILVGVLLGILLQDGNNLAAAIVSDSFTGAIVLGPVGNEYSCKERKSKL